MRTTIMVFFLSAVFYLPLIYVFFLIVKALRKYLKSSDVRKEKDDIKKHWEKH